MNDSASPATSRRDTVSDAVPARTAAAAVRNADGKAESTTVEVGAVRSDAAQPIPYRSDASGMAASMTGALLVAVLLLAVLALALRFAKRRGLLDRWIVAAPGRAAERTQMRVVHALRVSPKTTLYRIRDADRQYLLVESLAHTTLTPLSDRDMTIGTDDERDDGR